MRHLLPVLLLAPVGCFHGTQTHAIDPTQTSAVSGTPQQSMSKAAGTESSAQRLLSVSGKVVRANPQLGMRPIFLTVGTPTPEIFHKGGKTDGYQVFVSEGMIRACRDDDMLAAVVCAELGRMVAERETVGAVSGWTPPVERIGTDSGGTFGSPDGTAIMEAARREQARKSAKPATPASPESLARGYMAKAGFSPQALDAVAPLRREAEKNCAVEKQMRGSMPGA